MLLPLNGQSATPHPGEVAARLGEGNSMFFKPPFGRSRTKQLAALLGTAAAVSMVASPIVVNAFGTDTQSLPRPEVVVNAAYTPPVVPYMQQGGTATWTPPAPTPPAPTPATQRAVPRVRAPHR